jgi:hypothetical protein
LFQVKEGSPGVLTCGGCPGIGGGDIACKAKAIQQLFETSNMEDIQKITAIEASE